MKTSEMELPQHLYTETTSPCGTMTKFIFAPDKLVSWADEGRGDAIARLCQTVYERNIANIEAWESERILQLEDEWMTAGNDEDMYGHKYMNIKHYHTTREDVAREAELKRVSAMERMSEHQDAIEKLVQEARVFISAHEVRQEEDSMLPYLLAIAAFGAMAYVLVT